MYRLLSGACEQSCGVFLLHPYLLQYSAQVMYTCSGPPSACNGMSSSTFRKTYGPGSAGESFRRLRGPCSLPLISMASHVTRKLTVTIALARNETLSSTIWWAGAYKRQTFLIGCFTSLRPSLSSFSRLFPPFTPSTSTSEFPSEKLTAHSCMLALVTRAPEAKKFAVHNFH